MLTLDGNTLAGGSLTFVWLSARPRVPRIWPGPLPGPLWIRLAREEGEAGGRVRSWRHPVPCCRWVAGSEKRGPRPGGCRRKSWGFRACLTPRVAKAGLHSPGICCMLKSVLSVCRTVRCCWGVLRGCVPPGRRCRTCRQARLRVLGGRPMRRTGAPWGLLKFACTRAGRAARVSASVRTAGCRQSPSATARIRWHSLFDNTPLVTGSAAGSACVAGPFARPLADPLRGRGGSGGMGVPGVTLPPFLIAGGSLRSGKCGPRPGDVGRGRWARICVRHRGLLRLASTPLHPAGVSGRRVVP